MRFIVQDLGLRVWDYGFKGLGRGVVGTLTYRVTSLARKRTPLGPYRRPMPRVLGGSWGDGRFLMGEVPLYGGEGRVQPLTAVERMWHV